MQRLTTKEKLTYCVGNFGNGIAIGINMFWVVYFFFPPLDAEIPYVIPQGSLFLGLTLIGLILAGNRMIDAITDPWIASVCDRSKNPKGKYIPMMRLAAPGVLFFMAAIFFIPDPGEITALNVIWITASIALQALSHTMYNIPYYALQVKIAPHTDDKLDLNTIMGAFWFSGLVLASFASIIWIALGSQFDLDKVNGIQITFLILAAIGTIALLIPTFLLKETDYQDVDPSQTRRPTFSATIRVIKNDHIFLRFLLILVLYYLATYMFETGLTYYVTVLARMSEAMLGTIASITGVASIFFYPLVNRLSKKKGKKPLMKMAFMLLGITLAMVSIIGLGSISPMIFIVMLVILSPYPQAILSILPGAMTADIATYSKNKTGQDNSGMYMAGFWFVQKIAATFAMLLFTSFLQGKNMITN